MLWTKLSQVVVAQTSKVRCEPTSGGSAAAADAAIRAREALTADGRSESVRSRVRSRSWKASAAVGALSNPA